MDEVRRQEEPVSSVFCSVNYLFVFFCLFVCFFSSPADSLLDVLSLTTEEMHPDPKYYMAAKQFTA